MEARTLTKYHVLLGKSVLECCKPLKDGLGTHASSCEIVCQWVNAIRNVWDETNNTLAMKSQQWNG
jgi:hypothetical protein